ncbi:unnamed protein product [Orchesella dallaii]|uniref:Uncharacterized protein n=1 Tax=Orchesella dallaii TaxID=48710 RepID=A0ABP1RBI0_9HEXA
MPNSQFYLPSEDPNISRINSRRRFLPHRDYSTVRSVKDLERAYCDPNDPCCARPDPEIPITPLRRISATRRLCPPKNPMHFEYTMLHRQRMQILLSAKAEEQWVQDLTPEQVEEIQQARLQGLQLNAKRLAEQEEAAKAAAHTSSLDYFKDHPDLAVPIPPPKPLFINASGLKDALHGLGSMALAHEIAVNKDFKLKNIFEKSDPPHDLVNMSPQLQEKLQEENAANDMVSLDKREAYWRGVEDVLDSKPMSDTKEVLLDLMEMLKEGLLSTLLPHNHTVRQKILREMELTHISHQIEGGYFDLDHYLDLILATLAMVCCQVRDREILDCRKMTHKPSKVRKISELIEDVNLDMGNFIIGQCRNTIIQHCISYERDKFAGYVQTEYLIGNDPLAATRSWILRHTIPSRSFEEVMAYSFAEIVFDNWENKEWPETLALDWLRFPRIRDEIRRVSIIAAMVESTYSYAQTIMSEELDSLEHEKRQLIVVRNAKLLGKLREHLNHLLSEFEMQHPEKFDEAIEKCSESAARLINKHRRAELCSGITPEQAEKIKELVLPLKNMNDPGRLAFEKHIRDWLIILVTTGAQYPVSFPGSMSSSGHLVLLPVQDMLKLVIYNRGVFDVIYHEIYSGRFPPPKFASADEKRKAGDRDEGGEEEEIEPHVANLIGKLKAFTNRTLVYRKAKIDPRTQPMFTATGERITDREYQPLPEAEALEPYAQKRRDKRLLQDEPTAAEDYEGIAQIKVGEPDFMFGHTMADLLKILERDDIIAANKLRRIKERMEKEGLEKRVAKNLPIFVKEWSEGWGSIQQEYCRLQRIILKGATPLPRGAVDYPGGRRKPFPGACEWPVKVEIDEFPRFNEKGERLFYSRDRGRAFGQKRPPSPPIEPDYEMLGRLITRTHGAVSDDAIDLNEPPLRSSV